MTGGIGTRANAVVRLLLLGALALLVQVAFASRADAATIEAHPGSLGTIPDNPTQPEPRIVTFNVPGFENGTPSGVGIDIGLEHAYVGDLKAVLVSPTGVRQTIFSRTGFSAGSTDASKVSGVYRFSGRAPASPTWWGAAAATAEGAVIPPDSYRGSIPGGDPNQGANTSIDAFSGSVAHGPWSLEISDLDSGVSGSVTSATLHFNATQDADPATLGAIPDSPSAFPGSFNAPRDVTFTVDGLGRNAPGNVGVSMTFGPDHTDVGDLDVALIAPDGTQKTIFSRTGAGTTGSGGSSADLHGPYNFIDGNPNWWSAAANGGGTIPSGTYSASLPGGTEGATGANTSMTTAFAGVTNPNGVWTLRFRDGQLGNTGSVSSARLRLVDGQDLTAPPAPNAINTNPGPPSNSNTPKVIGTAEAGSTVRLYLNGSCAGIPAVSGSASQFGDQGIQLTVPSDITSTISAAAYDYSGNVSACDTTPIAYQEDSTGPAKPTLAQPGSPANFNSPAIHGSGAETGSLVAIFKSQDCSPGAFTGQISAATFNGAGSDFSVDDDTTTTFSVLAIDLAGNESACSDPVTYVEDSSTELIMSDTEPVSHSNENTPLFFGDTEPGATVELFKTGDCSGAPATSGSAEDLSTLGLAVVVADDSTTKVRGVATDSLGNVSPCSNAATYVEDSTAPNTKVKAKPKATVKTNSGKSKFQVKFKSTEPKTKFRCQLDRGELKSCKSPASGKVKAGKHTFLIVATDKAGNVDKTPARVTWKVKRN